MKDEGGGVALPRHLLWPALLGDVIDGSAIAGPVEIAECALVSFGPARLPVMVPAVGVALEGLCLKPDAAEAQERLKHYLSVLLRRASAADGAAALQDLATLPEGASARPFDEAAWTGYWSRLAAEAAEEVMAHHGRLPPERMWPFTPRILARAASRLAGREEAWRGPVDSLPGSAVRSRGVERSHFGFFDLDIHHLEIPLLSGHGTLSMVREVFVTSDAAIVLPYDPVADRVALVEQFRIGPHVRGDPAPWCLEPVAGLVDPGETPEETARREAEEEAGLALRDLFVVTRSYPSPGASTDFFHVFVGLADIPENGSDGHGVADEHEDIRTHVLPWRRFRRLLDEDEFRAGPLVLAGHWLARNRAALRRRYGPGA